jgi:hypothetical protein
VGKTSFLSRGQQIRDLQSGIRNMRDREGAKQGVQAEEGVPESGMKKTFFSL